MPILINVYFGSFTPFVTLGVFIGFLSAVGPALPVRRMGLSNLERTIIPSANDGAGEGILNRLGIVGDSNYSDFLSIARSFFFGNPAPVGPSLSPTSNDEFPARITNALATPASARVLLLTALHERGWSGLNDIAGDAIYFLDALQGMATDAGPYDECLYLHRLVCYIVLDVMCRQMNLLNGPALLDDITTDIASVLISTNPPTQHAFHLPPSASYLLLGDITAIDRAVHMVLAPIAASVVPLTLTLMRQAQTVPRVWAAFRTFARNPTSFHEYICSMPGTPSVKEIVDAAAIALASPSPQPSFRTLTLAPRVPGRGLPFINTLIGMVWGGRGTDEAVSQNTDLEGGLVLDGDELRYAAALFAAILIKF